MSKIYEDEIENKKYSGSGVFVDTVDEGTGVSSVNGKDGTVNITINNVNPSANVNIGISGDSIPVTSPASEDDPVQSIAEAVTDLKSDTANLFSSVNVLSQVDAALVTEDIAINAKINSKKSIENLQVNQDGNPINNHLVTIDLGLDTNTGLTGEVKNASESEGDFSTIELMTANCVPKKFIVQDKYQVGATSEVIADATHPYKFISSDDTIAITVGDNAGEIDIKALDNPLDKNFTFAEPMTTVVMKMMNGYFDPVDYFDNPYMTFDFTLKSTPDLVPKTSDMYMIAYYSDYMNRTPLSFKDGQGIFFIEGVRTSGELPDEYFEMCRIYATQATRNNKLMVDLNITVRGGTIENPHMYNYSLNTDKTKTEYTGTKIKINLSQKWSTTGLSLKRASFNPYQIYEGKRNIDPFAYNLVCGHIFFTYQYKE